jgi:flagellar M-ring protein FliF
VTGFAKTSEQVKDLLHAQPELVRTAGAGLLAVLLILLVVRPVATQAMALLRERPEPVVMSAQAELPHVEERMPLSAGEAQETAADRELYARAQRRRAAIDDEGVLEYVTAHVRRDPQQSVRLLEAWIGSREKAAS